ncbi:MAG: hypothetical protein H6718_10710 [Polyangiaceae bacterium]|nr:hypothetical protein [Polyangiaceae bacterium]MCB9607213.1 hypothetical protein [Polyangiaceae bacterium]
MIIGVRSGAAVLCALFISVSSSEGLAQQHVPIGGRTATMGGAGIAAGNDSALPYLNPAGLAGVPNDIFGVSASLFAYRERSVETVFFPRGFPASFGPTRIDDETNTSSNTFELPSSVMYFKRIASSEDFTALAGFALVIPEIERFRLSPSLDARLTNVAGRLLEDVTIKRDFTAYHLGPSYAMSVGKRLRLGASLFARYTVWDETNSSSRFLQLGNNAATSDNAQSFTLKRETLAFAPVIGTQVNVFESLWLGLSLHVPTINLWGRVDGATTLSDTTSDPADVSRVTNFSQDTNFHAETWRNDQSLRVGLGVAWDDREHFSAALDLVYRASRVDALSGHGVRHVTQYETGDIVRDRDERIEGTHEIAQGIEIHAGVELSLSALFALRAGGFYIDPLPTDEPIQWQTREREMGGSLGLGITSGSFDSTIGLSFTRTTGDFYALDEANGGLVATNTHSNTLFVVLSGSVTAEEAKETIERSVPVQVTPEVRTQ